MGWIATIAQFAGPALSAAGQFQQGQASRQVYEYNAALARYEAQYAQDRAKFELAQLDRDVEKYIGRQRALAGKSGTVPNVGSNLAVIEDTREQAAIDASLIRYEADVATWRANASADLLAQQGDQLYNAGLLNTGSTLLNAASKWDYRKLQSRSPYSNPPQRTGLRTNP